jgi:hypothetical protein
LRIIRDGREIRNMNDWYDSMPQRVRSKHWKSGRSAQELARAWVGRGSWAVPAEVTRLLESHPTFRGADLLEARPEERIQLDRFRGNTRNADLLIVASLAGEPLVITVEAKADESFGRTIGACLATAREADRSNAPARIERLARAVCGSGPG